MIVNNVTGLAKFAKAFNVPVILTTVLEARGGKIIKGLQDVFPDQKPIDRTYINAWQDKRIVDLVKGTGRKKLVMAALGPRCAWRCPLFTPSAKATTCTSSPTLQVAFLRKLMTWRCGEWCKQGRSYHVDRLSGEWQRDWARESTLTDTIKIVTEHGGESAVAFAWESQLLGASKP